MFVTVVKVIKSILYALGQRSFWGLMKWRVDSQQQ